MNRIFVFLFLLSIKCFSQETKLVVTGNKHFNKEYYVLRSDENVKHGTFVWYIFTDNTGKNINLLESGNYSHGKKDGQWDYFYAPAIKPNSALLTNNLRLRVNYENGVKNGAWKSYHLDTIANAMQTENYKHRKKTDSTVINLDLKELAVRVSGQYKNDVRIGRWSAFDHTGELIQLYDFNRSNLLYDMSVNDSVYNTGTRPALFLGGENELRQFILESLNPMTTQYIGRDSTRIIGEFIIQSNGSIDQLNVLKGKASRELHHEIVQILQETSGQWLPALERGKPAESKKVLAIDVFILERKWNSVRYTIKVSSL